MYIMSGVTNLREFYRGVGREVVGSSLSSGDGSEAIENLLDQQSVEGYCTAGREWCMSKKELFYVLDEMVRLSLIIPINAKQEFAGLYLTDHRQIRSLHFAQTSPITFVMDFLTWVFNQQLEGGEFISRLDLLRQVHNDINDNNRPII